MNNKELKEIVSAVNVLIDAIELKVKDIDTMVNDDRYVEILKEFSKESSLYKNKITKLRDKCNDLTAYHTI